jgi:hypothetical protein
MARGPRPVAEHARHPATSRLTAATPRGDNRRLGVPHLALASHFSSVRNIVRLVLPCLLLVLAVAVPSEAARRRQASSIGAHVLNRVTYGPDPWSRARIDAIGVGAFIQEQLHPEALDDSAVEALLTQFPSLTMGFQELRSSYGSGVGQLPIYLVEQELRSARILRAVASRRQLKEVLVDFWFDHFAVDVRKGQIAWNVSPYERIAIRPHVLGTFEELLLAVARSPAMGEYLDNRHNRVGSMNENFARELLELHTLGVGNYTEDDMVEVMRCFTGWTRDLGQPDGFAFDPSLHDEGPKSILGGALEIPANGGYQDGLDVIHFLATHPATAQHISRKLVIRFVSEDPPARLVDQAASVFVSTGGDLRAVMQTILTSPELLYDYRLAKVKRPVRLVVSAARATGADPALLNLKGMADRARPMGEDLFRVSAPTGYPDTSDAWAGPGELILRLNAMENAARGGQGFVRPFTYPAASGVEELVDTLVDQYFVGEVSQETRDGAIAYVDGLGLPEGDPRQAEQAAAYLLSSPEFMRH